MQTIRIIPADFNICPHSHKHPLLDTSHHSESSKRLSAHSGQQILEVTGLQCVVLSDRVPWDLTKLHKTKYIIQLKKL
jgi:hypothetical protein